MDSADRKAVVKAAAEEIQKEAAETRKVEVRRVRVWYVVLMGFLGMSLGLAIAFAFIVQSSRDSRKATCHVVIANQEAFRETPPTNETGQNLQRSWDDLARSLGCNQGK